MPDQQKLVYDWNLIGNSEPLAKKPVLLDDETLRDGLQSPTVSDPSIDDKIHLMHLMEDLGIQMLDIGLPGAGPRAYNDTLALATEIARSRMKIRPNCAARTTIQDIDPIIDIAEKTGVVIDAATFLGSSMIRQYVESWTMDDLMRRTEEAVTYVIHGCALGIGERVGNTPMDQMLVNLKLLGAIDHDLIKLKEYCETASRACRVTIPPGYPVFGSDAFRTATGVHAAAVIKAFKKGETELANSVYSGVPSHLFGLEQIIDIGPMSGKSNVIFWLEKRGIQATEERVNAIYNKAKQSDRLLTTEEVLQAIHVSSVRDKRNVI